MEKKSFIRKVKIGDTILLHYRAKLADGKIVGSSKNNEPKKLTLGKDEINRALETKIVGMSEGDSQVVTIPADKAYGPYYKNLVFILDRKKFKEKPEIGKYYRIKLKTGDKKKAQVTEIKESKVTLDANHILAGRDITYEIKLLKILN